MPVTVASLWIGNQLTDLEIASIRSFLATSHRVVLYSYEPVSNLPDGVELVDARQVLDTKEIVRHAKTGSPALHSDLFRYALLDKTDYIWSDLDVIALRPFTSPTGYLIGLESTSLVGSAILRLPKTSQALSLLRLIDENTKGIPLHLTGHRRLKYAIRNFAAGGVPISKWPWGAVGPQLLTHMLSETGEIDRALPISAFYSIPLSEAERFCRPNGYSLSEAPPDAFAIHLWGSKVKRILSESYGGKFPTDSFVARYLEQS